MIRTISEYRPGIYGEIAARQQARAARDAVVIRRLDRAADAILYFIILGFVSYGVWFTWSFVQP